MLGVICAIDREFLKIEELLEAEEHCTKTEVYGRTFYKGTVLGRPVCVTKCGVGKVSLAVSATLLACRFECTAFLFLGTAGGLKADLKVGDIVISTACVQHDFDARPFTTRHTLFSVGKPEIQADAVLVGQAEEACQAFVSKDFHALFTQATLDKLKIKGVPSVHKGVVLSGDQFISSEETKKDLQARLPDGYCVEMEGAALAQVCHEMKLPYVILRIISDNGDGEASCDFNEFCDSVSANMTLGIFKRFLESCK